MGHPRVNELTGYKKAHKVTRGLYVFCEELEKYCLPENSIARSLIVVGSCGLHIVCGIFKALQQCTEWDVKTIGRLEFLKKKK